MKPTAPVTLKTLMKMGFTRDSDTGHYFYNDGYDYIELDYDTLAVKLTDNECTILDVIIAAYRAGWGNGIELGRENGIELKQAEIRHALGITR